jgi:hypothetical protein
MKHKDILKRAWQILWDYKALWIFGFILAITTASGSSSNAANSASNSNQNQSTMEESWGESWDESWNEDWKEAEQEFERFFEEINPAEILTAAVSLAVLFGCMIVFIIIVVVIFRYMSETALIRMVDHYEDAGEKLSIRQGFRLGFSRTAVKVFLVDLVINLPLLVIGIAYVFLVMMPLLLLLTENDMAGVVGVVTAIGLFFIGIFLAFIIFTAISVLKHFFRRAVAIEGMGVFEAIGHGFQLVRKNLVDIGLMWLITIGINLGFSIILIPITLIMLIISAVFGGVVGLAVGGLMAMITEGALPIIVGVMAGVPIFFIMMIVPLGLLDGLREIFMSTTWTLTYREARALGGLRVESLDLEIDPDEVLTD